MNDEKWYENIPENGVLCMCNNSIVAVIHSYDECIDCPFVSIGQSFNKAVPLTAEEWWKFAPWQTADIAPKDRKIITLCDKTGFIGTAKWNDNLFVSSGGFQSLNSGQYTTFTHWMDLPKVVKND